MERLKVYNISKDSNLKFIYHIFDINSSLKNISTFFIFKLFHNATFSEIFLHKDDNLTRHITRR